MSLRSTLLLALVALALGTLVWWLERGTAQEERAERAAKLVLELERDAVRELALPLEEGGEARLVRDPDDASSWRLTEPLAFAADEGVVTGLLGTLEKLEASAVIEPAPDDLEPFGLAGGGRRLLVVAGDAPVELRIGARTPVGSDRYVARSDGPGRLYTLAQWKVDALVHSLRDLRDKRITRLESPDVTGLRVSGPGGLIVAAEREEREDGTRLWELREPLREPADGDAIRRLVEDLVLGRAAAFVDEPAELADHGLDPPELVLELAAGDARERIELGRAADKSWARVAGRGPVLEIPDRLLEIVPRERFGYRFKRVLSVDRNAVRRVELRFPRDDATFAFLRGEDETWSPAEGAPGVESLLLDDLVWALRELDASSIEERSFEPAALGLEPAAVRAVLLGDDDAELGWLELGDPEVPAGLPARSSQSDTVWRVPNELAKDVPLGLDAFENRWVSKDEEPEAEGASPEPPELP